MKMSVGRSGLIFLICIFSIGLASAQPVITVDSALPADIPNGAPNATLQQSAAFAWQEFIALNWPALQGQRDVPDTSQKFGAGDGLLVWESFRDIHPTDRTTDTTRIRRSTSMAPGTYPPAPHRLHPRRHPGSISMKPPRSVLTRCLPAARPLLEQAIRTRN